MDRLFAVFDAQGPGWNDDLPMKDQAGLLVVRACRPWQIRPGSID